MTLVQIHVRKGSVPQGREPRIDLELEPGQYIVRFDINDNHYSNSDRKTFDAWWAAWIATPQGDD